MNPPDFSRNDSAPVALFLANPGAQLRTSEIHDALVRYGQPSNPGHISSTLGAFRSHGHFTYDGGLWRMLAVPPSPKELRDAARERERQRSRARRGARPDTAPTRVRPLAELRADILATLPQRANWSTTELRAHLGAPIGHLSNVLADLVQDGEIRVAVGTGSKTNDSTYSALPVPAAPEALSDEHRAAQRELRARRATAPMLAERLRVPRAHAEDLALGLVGAGLARLRAVGSLLIFEAAS